MLSPHMLKSTGLTRRQTIGPRSQNEQKKEEKLRRNRSGSLLVYVEEDGGENGVDEVIAVPAITRRISTVELGRRNSRTSSEAENSPSPMLTPKVVNMRTRNSIATFSYMDSDTREYDDQVQKEAKLPRRKTSTAVTLMRKLKIQKSDPVREKEERKVEVHHYSNDPTIAWEMLKIKCPVKVVKPMPLDAPMKDDCVRFVCLANINGQKLNSVFIPDGDVLLVAGNFTHSGHPAEVKEFNRFIGSLPHKHKVVIAGNRELTFDSNWQPTSSVFSGLEKLFKGPVIDRASFVRDVLQTALAQEQVTDPRDLLTNCIYLEDDSVVIYGLRIYGSPWVPLYDNLAFNLPRGQRLLEKWNLIPRGVDVLVTQTPPLGYGDLLNDGHRAGCVELLSSMRRRIHAKYHVFGHIVDSYGCTTDGYTKYINASIVNSQGRPVNRPIIFDIPLPEEKYK